MQEPERQRRPIDRRLIAGIVAVAGIAAALAAYGIPNETLEWVPWAMIGVGAVVIAIRRIPQDAFRHLAFAFMLAGFVSGTVKGILWTQFLETHPLLVELATDDSGAELSRTGLLITETIKGAILGAIFGGVAWAASRHYDSSPRQESGK